MAQDRESTVYMIPGSGILYLRWSRNIMRSPIAPATMGALSRVERQAKRYMMLIAVHSADEGAWTTTQADLPESQRLCRKGIGVRAAHGLNAKLVGACSPSSQSNGPLNSALVIGRRASYSIARD